MIVNIIGTNGAGKTTLARQIMKLSDAKPVAGGAWRTWAGYEGQLRGESIFVVGDYASEYGGCDGARRQDDVRERVRWAAERYDHVLFEGAIVSTCWAAYARFLAELAPRDHQFAFLTPPLDVCVERVTERRRRRGNERPLSLKSITNNHRFAVNAVGRARAAGVPYVVLDWRRPLPSLLACLSASEAAAA